MARQPDVSWDSQRGRLVINWRIPTELQPLLSRQVCPRISRSRKWYRDRFAKSTTPDQAAKLKTERLAEYHALLDAARSRFGTPQGQQEASEAIQRAVDEARARWHTVTEPAALAEIDRLNDHASLLELGRRLGVSVPVNLTPAASKVYTFRTAIDELWMPNRRRLGKAVDDATVSRLMRSKMARLTAHLGHDNMAKVSRDELETYFDTKFPGAAVGTLRDHIIQTKALFAIATEREKIDSNPAKRLKYSKDNDNPGRPFQPSERAAIARLAWQECDDETVKWLWSLACIYGPRIAEFAEARLKDVVEEDGVPILFLDRLHRKGAEKTLKTTDSKRWLPIHSALRAPFMARVERLRKKYGEDGPLFGDLRVYDGRRNKAASMRANAWLDAMVEAGKITIADADNKSFHSLRHTISTMLKGRKWADFITGHAAPNVKGRVYEHPPLDEVVADVETLEWPSVARAG